MGANMPDTSKGLTIGRLARAAGSNVETVRYYERQGLIGAPPRTSGGHRQYDDADLQRLTFIRRSRELGFSITDIRRLLSLADGARACDDARDIAQDHLMTIREKISDLKRMESTLETMIRGCRPGETPRCPILQSLSGPVIAR